VGFAAQFTPFSAQFCTMVRPFSLSYLSQARSRAVSFVFASNSLLFGTWAALVPQVQERLRLSNGALGLVLLGIPIGSLLIMPFTGRLIHRWRTGPVTLVSTIALCLATTLLFLAPDTATLVAGLILFGLANGVMDVAMNAAAAAVEEHEGITFWSACHGMWSLGGMLGAGLVSLTTGWLSPAAHVAGLSASIALFTLLASRLAILGVPHRAEESASVSVRLNRSLLGLVVVALCIMLGEGAIADWSAVYLRQAARAPEAIAGLGYAGFSLAMALVRFSGDGLRGRLGGLRLVQYGALLATVGLVLVIAFPRTEIAILGFALTGAGFANVIPIVFSAASRVEGLAPGVGIATISLFGYGGFLLGPPLIGLIAEGISIAAGLAFVALSVALAGLAAGRAGIR